MNSTSDTRHSVTDWQKNVDFRHSATARHGIARHDRRARHDAAGLGAGQGVLRSRNASGQRHRSRHVPVPEPVLQVRGRFRARRGARPGKALDGGRRVLRGRLRERRDHRQRRAVVERREEVRRRVRYGRDARARDAHVPDGATFTGGFERNARVGRGARRAGRSRSTASGRSTRGTAKAWRPSRRPASGTRATSSAGSGTGEARGASATAAATRTKASGATGAATAEAPPSTPPPARRTRRAFEADRPVDLPAFLELEILGPVPEDGGERPKLGTEEAPLAATAGRALGEGGAPSRASARARAAAAAWRARGADVSAAETPAETQPHLRKRFRAKAPTARRALWAF